jgi:hypothetical protein
LPQRLEEAAKRVGRKRLSWRSLAGVLLPLAALGGLRLAGEQADPAVVLDSVWLGGLVLTVVAGLWRMRKLAPVAVVAAVTGLLGVPVIVEQLEGRHTLDGADLVGAIPPFKIPTREKAAVTDRKPNRQAKPARDKTKLPPHPQVAQAAPVARPVAHYTPPVSAPRNNDDCPCQSVPTPTPTQRPPARKPSRPAADGEAEVLTWTYTSTTTDSGGTAQAQALASGSSSYRRNPK